MVLRVTVAAVVLSLLLSGNVSPSRTCNGHPADDQNDQEHVSQIMPEMAHDRFVETANPVLEDECCFTHSAPELVAIFQGDPSNASTQNQSFIIQASAGVLSNYRAIVANSNTTFPLPPPGAEPSFSILRI